MLSTGGAREVGLLAQHPVHMLHLCYMDGVQADMEQEAGQDQPEYSGTAAGSNYQQGSQDNWVMKKSLLR